MSDAEQEEYIDNTISQNEILEERDDYIEDLKEELDSDEDS